MRRIVLGAAKIMSVFRRPIHAGAAFFALAVVLLSGCGHRAARVNAPVAPARLGSTETGVASWYGFPYDGRRAASGEIYDMRQLTAAHRSLPFQTWVEVTNLSNGRQVNVRINDRGPFVKGRIVDLSQAAARDIDMLRAGTARVRLKVIPPPSLAPHEPAEVTSAPIVPTPPATDAHVADPATPIASSPVIVTPDTAPPDIAPTITAPPVTPRPGVGFVVQAGAFSDRDRAESLRAILEDLFADARIVSNRRTPPLWRVIVGREMTREQAAELAVRVRRETNAAVVVPEPGETSNSAPDSDPQN
jgi:rare lipoprotein A (peptidoglycan hydrolase)